MTEIATHLPAYVLITPARNAARHIELTLRSVIAQTVRPRQYVIVSDGSTDGTDEIIERYARQHDWITGVRRERAPGTPARDFSAKVRCFNLGLENLKTRDYAFIGNIDSDISFDNEFFAYLLAQFAGRPRLGLAGTLMQEENYDVLKDSYFDDRDVFGACQLFRRECFEQIGGYFPSKMGGIDWIAVRTARMKGWETRTFREKFFVHHHPMGTGDKNIYFAKFDYGRKDYFFGNHPLWEMARVAFQMTRRPLLIGGLLLFWGYASSWARGLERSIPADLVRFHRGEQMEKLRGLLHKLRLRHQRAID